jgi:DNA repair exonuclease SbcCD ATPase subunit
MQPIRLTRLFAQNALASKKLDVRLDGQGLVLVRGCNGSGKSATFEVLRHILLGSTARGIKGKELIRAGSRNGYLGTLDIERDGIRYTVQQSVAHKEHGSKTLIYRGDELISHQRAKVRTQKQVSEELLGMTAQQFDSWVFISQEAAHPLVNGTGVECAAYLSESFGLDVYDEMRKKLKDQIKQAESQVGEIRAYEDVLRSLNEKLAGRDAKEHLDKIKSIESLLVTDRATLEAKQIELYEARSARSNAEAYARLKAKLGDYEGQTVEEITETGKIVADKLLRVEQRIIDHKATVQRRMMRTNLEARVVRLTQEVKALAKAAKKAKESGDIARDLLKKAEAESIRLAGVAAPLERLQRLDGKGECPTCGNELDAEHHAAELLRAKNASDRLRDVRQKIMRLSEAVRDGEDTIRDHQHKSKQLDELQAQFDEIGETTDGQIDLPKLEGRREALRDTLRGLESAADAAEELQKMPRPKRTASDVDALSREIREIEARIEENQDSRAHERSTIQEIERLTKQQQEATQKVERLLRFKVENELRKKLQKALHRLKVRRIHGIVEALAQTLPAYVEAMFGGEDVQVEVDDGDPESIERWCSRPHPTVAGERVRIPLRALSKGERARLRVAFIWAVRRLMRPERTVNILILDEADGGLDQQGLEAYGALLEQLRGEYESVFVISHRSELNGVNFDHTWTIKKKAGISHLSQE